LQHFPGRAHTALHESARTPVTQDAQRQADGLRRVFMMRQIRFVRNLMAGRILQQRRRKLVRKLSAHSDHELQELGFSRADFRAIMKGTYRR
jgi:uncharacterized protein YjiS (DUF1127 family)